MLACTNKTLNTRCTHMHTHTEECATLTLENISDAEGKIKKAVRTPAELRDSSRACPSTTCDQIFLSVKRPKAAPL